MKVLVNALSVTNMSGRHVLLGHLSRFAAWTADRHEYTVLYHAANKDLVRDLGKNVQWLECPPSTAGWVSRAVWERNSLSRTIASTRSQVVYSPAGTTTPGVDVPQVAFAQNPWALVPELNRRPAEHAKAWLQRIAYREAMATADVMVFNSRFMHDAYKRNARRDARASRIIYQGIDEETFDAAASARDSSRKPWQIVSVSAMASHKGVETLVAAIGRLRTGHRLPATLLLIGSWPDSRYRARIERQVQQLGLEDAVEFVGHVSRQELHNAYATSRIFSLMSRCESFGIPAVEAQAFRTPVVSSNCTAIPEVCGEGGVFPRADDDVQVAEALAELLTNEERWSELSARARANAERFRWDVCSRPYTEVFDSLS